MGVVGGDLDWRFQCLLKSSIKIFDFFFHKIFSLNGGYTEIPTFFSPPRGCAPSNPHDEQGVIGDSMSLTYNITSIASSVAIRVRV
jgi:hypothetical protein